MTFGLPPKQTNPLDYTGPDSSILPAVNIPRAPTITDQTYPLFTIWRNSNKNAVIPDQEGDAWILTRFQVVAGVLNAIWERFTIGAVGTLLSLSDNANTKVFPDGTGNIQFTAGAGVTIVSNPGAHQIAIGLTGGGVAIDQVGVDAHTAPGTNPVLPAVNGQINITGGQVATGIIGANAIRTNSLAINTFTIEIQRSASSAFGDSTLNGISHFNSLEFVVGADGFVQTIPGHFAESINVDAHSAPGTDPVVPDGLGDITMTGAQVATGTIGANVIRTDSLAANSLTIEIQRSTAVAATDSTKNGVSHFDSHSFAVDGNGFVTLTGGGGMVSSVGVDAHTAPGTNPVLPTGGGLINITGAQVATGTIGANVIRTDSLAANTLTVEVQRSTAVAATDSTKNGVSHFDSKFFSSDASAFISSTATTAARFYAFQNVDIPNVTGDSTLYTVPFDTTLFNVTGSYNTATGLFTAPINGIYQFNAGISISNIGAGHTTATFVYTDSGGTLNDRFTEINPAAVVAASGTYNSAGSTTVSLVAGQTFSVIITVRNSTKTITLAGAAQSGMTYFNGSLLVPT